MTTVQEPLAGPFSLLESPLPSSVENHLPQNALASAARAPETGLTDSPTDQPRINPNPYCLPRIEPLPPRCLFTFSDGRRCRMDRAALHPSLCRFHAQREDELFGVPQCAAELQLHAVSEDLTTATGVNRALAQVFRLLGQKRISQREAVAFAYLAQLLLQTVAGVRAESVAAFGYKSWAAELKTKLQPKLAPDPDRPEDARLASASTHSPGDPGDPDPSAIPAVPAFVSAPAIPCIAAPSLAAMPDFADLLSRALDLFDGKYAATPEGRREASALLRELDLDLGASAKRVTRPQSALAQTPQPNSTK